MIETVFNLDNTTILNKTAHMPKQLTALYLLDSPSLTLNEGLNTIFDVARKDIKESSAMLVS
jgi:hypothetical protein